LPPEGYDSVKGVKNSPDLPTEFKGNEYVVYRTGQQRMRYLVEFRLPNDQDIEEKEDILNEIDDQISDTEDVEMNDVSLDDVKDVNDPLNKVQAGLKIGDGVVPLQSVHIRAQLIDLAGKVVVLQSYKNDSPIPIEAKYVFPLDDMAAGKV
jgi:poly [ADP-ribose] polymerase